MNKFTKGPWKITGDIGDLGSASAAVSAGDTDWVASVHGSHNDEGVGFPSDEGGRANAHLIAASPDMYEALASALKISDLWVPAVVDAEHESEAVALYTMRTIFIRVLAKARGESNE